MLRVPHYCSGARRGFAPGFTHEVIQASMRCRSPGVAALRGIDDERRLRCRPAPRRSRRDD
jgi:hypothetical protein